MEELPALVTRASELARELGFPLGGEQAGPGRPSACLPGTGRFLSVLAARCRHGRIGEIGTGAGLGTAWMASAMPADCTLVTVEIDEQLAAAAARLFATDRRVDVLAGDAYGLLPANGPFDLLFADGGRPDTAGLASLAGLLRLGGQIVMDDVTPMTLLPAHSPLRGRDVKRDFFFGDPRLVSTEVVLPDLRNALLVGTRQA